MKQNVRLTKRDLELLQDLYTVKYLNSKRICKLYSSYKSCMCRLKLMERNGYIRQLERNLNGEIIYCITKKACDVLDLPFETILKTDKLNHYLACADFYFYVKNKGLNQVELEKQYYFKFENKKMSFRPDIVFNSDRWYFVEIDLSNRRFEDKIVVWESFCNSGEFLKYFDKFPPIIIVSTNILKVQQIVDKNKTIELNYVFKDYNEIKNFNN